MKQTLVGIAEWTHRGGVGWEGIKGKCLVCAHGTTA